MRKIKKVIQISVIAICIGLSVYQINNIEKTNKQIEKIQNQIQEKEKISQEYLELYNEINKEVDDIENVSKKINLLKRTINENEELYTLLQKDFEDLKMQNNELEKELIKLTNQKKNEENTFILGKKITYNQFPNYPTGCESVALHILLKYNGINAPVEEIISKLKKGELPYEVGNKKYGGNPEIEFIGNPKSRYSYGVYNKPLADVANTYKKDIISKTGLKFEEMLEIVKEGKPVLVWTTINLSKPYVSQSWTYRPTGETINWIRGEHAVVVIGFNQNQIIVSDPYTGTIRYFDKATFENRYNYLGRRALYY